MRIYVSFSGKDRQRATQLVQWLTANGIDHDAGFDLMIEQWSLAAGQTLGIQQFLQADVLLCLMTPAWSTSEMCQRELAHFVRASKPVIPMLYEPINEAARPPYRFVDLTGGIEDGYHAVKGALRKLRI